MKIALFFREFYPHPVEKVWRAVSTREGLAVWLMDNDFEPQEGKRFALRYPPHAGGRGWINCQVVAIEPPERIVWSWQAAEDDRPGQVEIRLRAVESGTELTLQHTGETDPARRLRYASGWSAKFAELRALLARI
jgi:uncharacterized protein YndB with AHSA1/START domain